MKRTTFKKIIALNLVFVMSLNFVSFADDISSLEKYGPALAAESEKKTLPDGMVLQESPLAGSAVSGNTADIISQIAVVNQSANYAGQGAYIQAPGASVTTNGGNPTNLITNPTLADLQNPYGTGNELLPSENTLILPSGVNATNLVVKETTAEKPSNISAPAYILINASTNQIYTMKNQTEKYNPSGLANLMTAYIASTTLSMDTSLKVNATALYNIDKDASIIALSNKDKITLRDAIASMFVKGAVDAANVIAENVSSNKAGFVELMNATAVNLGMQNTHFVDPAGILDGNESTALDMAILFSKVCEKPELIELLSLVDYVLPAAEKRDKLIIYNKNTQLSKESASFNGDVAASRMAFTSNSKYCIASLMNYNNNKIIAIVLKA